MKRIKPQTHFAKRLRRLGWSLKDAERWTKVPYETLKNYNTGKTEAPRAVMRLLAVYRLLRWTDQ